MVYTQFISVKKFEIISWKMPTKRVQMTALNTVAGTARMLAPARPRGYFAHCAFVTVRALIVQNS